MPTERGLVQPIHLWRIDRRVVELAGRQDGFKRRHGTLRRAAPVEEQNCSRLTWLPTRSTCRQDGRNGNHGGDQDAIRIHA